MRFTYLLLFTLILSVSSVHRTFGCTVGQLDEEALFYLMSRGISKKDSISLLLSAFSSEITEKIEDEKIKEKYETMILTELEGLNHG